MKGLKYGALFVAVITGILCFSGCGSSPPSRFYALSSMEPKAAESQIRADNVEVVAVGPVEIPAYLARQEIVTRSSRNVLSVADFDLWGGPLEDEVDRVIVENLSVLLAGKGAAAVGWRTKGPVSYKIPISVVRFDAQGETLTLIAQWSLVDNDGDAIESGRESLLTKRVAGKEYSDVVAAMSEALVDLSKELSVAISSVVAGSKVKEGKK